jgi:type II secretory ATPase GspE/PulE/Tfp pilus assembly ATPase PilB-like protein
MMQTLAAEAASYTSVVKVVIALLVLLGWAKFATVVDKDAMYFHLNRQLWNLVEVICGCLAIAALFFVPSFALGLIVAILLVLGGAVAYHLARNKTVPDEVKWTFNAEGLKNFFGKREEEKALKKALIRFKPAKGAREGLKPVPLEEDEEYAAHVEFETLIEPAIARKAQYVEIQVGETGAASVMSIDGVEYKQAKLGTKQAMAVIDYLKAMCAMDVADRRKKQTGKCKIESPEGTHDLKLATSGSSKGVKATITIDPVKQLSIAYKDIGLVEAQQVQFEPVIESGKGVVVVAANPGQGRTNTLYALTERHDPYTLDIHTVEVEIERELEGIHQNAIEASEQPGRLNSLFLRDPQVVTVMSVSDPAVAKSIATAGADGRRVYAGLRCDDAFTALRMWIKAVGDPDLVSRSLEAVVAQKLIRRLCGVCRQKYKPDAEALRKLNLPSDKGVAFYKSGGQVAVKGKMEQCPACNGLGYQGRVGIFEVMVFDDEAKNLIRSGKLDELKSHLRRNQQMLMQEAAVEHVKLGDTSISEVARAMAPEQKEG